MQQRVVEVEQGERGFMRPGAVSRPQVPGLRRVKVWMP
jgi:hypothetical protein